MLFVLPVSFPVQCLHLYSDFRWSETLLKQIRQNIEKKQVFSDTDVKQLLQLIDPALEKQSGLMAYGD